jgi:hypothetical protein
MDIQLSPNVLSLTAIDHTGHSVWRQTGENGFNLNSEPMLRSAAFRRNRQRISSNLIAESLSVSTSKPKVRSKFVKSVIYTTIRNPRPPK